ncbi:MULTISPECIES: PTS transporter subunit EIIC [Paenibacillus]|uniref:Permease IIC component n=1 Tax=Paenibacillus odorifer TaxID=189426 RepID=A0A1R0X291_9BACL|nr:MULTISPECIES: PTS transporter subunit EIIC [Paenibacillus]AIQ75837.1 PTS cellbiose transporter subunit IIC [Paenibacillus odorifer]AWV35126.1 PTS cellbiose transporter subunit IIC [Paenibacillus odorifer]ETT56963.1 PTS system, lactose/cellobiose family IIC subunit [Paenibacillus sp. FSL H8-237]MEC0131302.1 PTS transporter subunit EIIC [Paenibacillus odorifer]MEC0222059.1 PTS transporter subunit EIIC [Paenibacillus odorifer]
MAGGAEWRAKIQKVSTKIQKNTYISAISNGLMALMPILILGAIFSLINALKLDPYQNFLESTGLKTYTSIPATVTTDLIALYAVFSIAYNFATQHKQQGFSAGILALMSFLLVTPKGLLDDGVTKAFGYSWLGAKGLFVAIILALLVGKIYTFVLEKKFYIKMPKGVPPTVEKSFAALTPGFIVAVLMLVLTAIFAATKYGNMHEFVFSIIQLPLTSLGGTWWAMLICIFVIHLLWFFGVHGTLVVYSVVGPIWVALGLENLDAYQRGVEGTHIIGSPFFPVYVLIGGAGATLGLIIAMLFAKSTRYKTLGKLAIIPSLIGVNEPVIFGMPLVLNVRFMIPFILTPLVSSGLAILLTTLGILPVLHGIQVPLGIPVLVNGWMNGGWRVSAFQLVMIGASFMIYYPFFKKADAEALEQEQQAEAKAAATAATN